MQQNERVGGVVGRCLVELSALESLENGRSDRMHDASPHTPIAHVSGDH